MGYGVVLIGHGLPFWLASTIYVTGSILILQRLSRDADERRFDAARAGSRRWSSAWARRVDHPRGVPGAVPGAHALIDAREQRPMLQGLSDLGHA